MMLAFKRNRSVLDKETIDIVRLQKYFSDQMNIFFDLRGKYSDDKPEFNKPEWVVLMCKVFHKKINELGGNVELSTVMAKESLACGHADYHSKFALYCAELCMINHSLKA